MLNWIMRRLWSAQNRFESIAEPAEQPEPALWHGRVMSGRYLALYTYLKHRYANTVVLTFSEIEDLLGFTLPETARLDRAWWANTDPKTEPSGYSDSWILASRTAKPNLLARTVVFERA